MLPTSGIHSKSEALSRKQKSNPDVTGEPQYHLTEMISMRAARPYLSYFTRTNGIGIRDILGYQKTRSLCGAEFLRALESHL